MDECQKQIVNNLETVSKLLKETYYLLLDENNIENLCYSQVCEMMSNAQSIKSLLK